MSAFDLFRSFNESLTKEKRDSITELIHSEMRELMAARSEDARIRLVREYIRKVKSQVIKHKTPT